MATYNMQGLANLTDNFTKIRTYVVVVGIYTHAPHDCCWCLVDGR